MAAAMSTPILSATESALPSKKKPTRKLIVEQIGEFLFELCQQQLLSPNNKWCIEKSRMRQEFRKYANKLRGNNAYFALMYYYKTSDIGTILRRTNYLRDTERGSKLFCINDASIMKYRHGKLVSYVEQCKKAKKQASDETIEQHVNNLLKEELIVDENEVETLTYQGRKIETRNKDRFQSTDFYCYICEINFDTHLELLEHTKDHRDNTNFKHLKTMQKDTTPHFEITYSPCINSHYFCFRVKATAAKYIVEKVVIINNIRAPLVLLANGEQVYYVDAHLFTLFVEQPVVIIHHELELEDLRQIEQHHFLRTADLPETTCFHIPMTKTMKITNHVPQYLPTNKMRLAMQENFRNEDLVEMCTPFADYINNALTLTPKNITPVLHTLLQVEDMLTIYEYSKLVQRKVLLHRSGREYTFKIQVAKYSVSRCAEKDVFKDQFLMPQNNVFIIAESDDTKQLKQTFFLDLLLKKENQRYFINSKISKVQYGQFERVHNGYLTLSCDDNLPSSKLYMIIFRPARITLRYQYRALELLAGMPQAIVQRFLFPLCREMCPVIPAINNLQLQNRNIANNPEHLQAVQQIVNGSHNEAPYIIFGPPGTGKTTVLIEAVLQLYMTHADAKILITAGPNSACDEIARHLTRALTKMNNPRAIARIYCNTQAKRRNNIDKLLLKYSNLYGEHFYPHMDILHEYRIVVCTLTVVGILCNSTFGKNPDGSSVYTHIFLDEGAASSETESLVGLVGTMSTKAKLIIAGDPKQLGAIIKSQRAAQLGLGASLLERLLDCDCYGVSPVDEYNRALQIRLYRNYRSHPQILKLFNDLFYEKKLVSAVANVNFSLAEKWYRLPNPNFPIIFQAVYGKTKQKLYNTSWYNRTEQRMVVDFVRDLMLYGINGVKIKQSDIGIISPYKQQHMHIQSELVECDFPLIEVGSAEMFRGIEKPIIIVSFVRSSNRSLGSFLSDEKRLNVMLSRAKSLLILIGNPRLLSKNSNLKHIIMECKLNKTYNSIEPENIREKVSKPTKASNTTKPSKSADKSNTSLKENL